MGAATPGMSDGVGSYYFGNPYMETRAIHPQPLNNLGRETTQCVAGVYSSERVTPGAHLNRIAFVSEREANLRYIMHHRHELGSNGDVGYIDTPPLK